MPSYLNGTGITFNDGTSQSTAASGGAVVYSGSLVESGAIYLAVGYNGYNTPPPGQWVNTGTTVDLGSNRVMAGIRFYRGDSTSYDYDGDNYFYRYTSYWYMYIRGYNLTT